MIADGKFGPQDLIQLEERLLGRAFAVVALREVRAGNRARDVIGFRHDIDSGTDALATAVAMARWEAELGYRSTFFVLHGTDYWRDEIRLREALETVALLGHEIGIHTNAVAEALRTGDDPAEILLDALGRLRGWGHQVRGTVGHGDRLCRDLGFANDEQFAECEGLRSVEPGRLLRHGGRSLRIEPLPLAAFDLDYEAITLGRTLYQTDSNGRWLVPFGLLADRFAASVGASDSEAAADQRIGQLHLVTHPDHWAAAFADTRALVGAAA